MIESVVPLLAPGSTPDQPVDPNEGYSGLIGWVLGLMESMGEVGVGVAVFLENFIPPIPSEAVLPGAGFLAWDGRMNAYVAILMATLGALVGAWLWWGVGYLLGPDRTRAIVDRIPLMSVNDVDRAERVFTRWGRIAVLVGRCIPLVRSFVSIPAGIVRMPLLPFTLYTALGSLVWNSLWVGLGYALGPKIEPSIERWSGVLDKLVVGVIAGAVIWFVAVRLRQRSAAAPTDE